MEKVLRDKWRSEGRCITCGGPGREGLTKCAECARKTKENIIAKEGQPCVECNINKRTKYSPRCVECRNDYNKAWYANKRAQVIKHYGGKCVCCGESDYRFLTLDHINNDGHRQRAAQNYNSWPKAAQHGYPKDLQLMCYNCNCGKARNGGVCPHKDVIELPLD